MGKGSKRRPESKLGSFSDNFDRIFGDKPQPDLNYTEAMLENVERQVKAARQSIEANNISRAIAVLLVLEDNARAARRGLNG